SAASRVGSGSARQPNSRHLASAASSGTRTSTRRSGATMFCPPKSRSVICVIGASAYSVRMIRLMRVGNHKVPISNPDKVYFPERGLTKGDLVRYYVDVAECALPHVRRRPFHMVRYPNGVDGDFFHQKRVPKHLDYDREKIVQFPSSHSTVFALIDNKAALAWVINLGCIELHTWHSRAPEIEKPDYLLIDLDPSKDGQWPYVREIALVVRELMEELGLAAYPPTSA